jgi:hypothetical protein
VSGAFEQFFRSSVPARDKYLSRLFGLFSEQIVRAWCACPQAPYEDLGRPTLCEPGLTRGHTLDFTFRRRNADATYVAESKCELEFNGYRYLRLTNPNQIRHHTSAAFAKFLRVASDPASLDVRRLGRPQPVDGAILVWGAISPEGRDAAMKEFALSDVLSIEAMVTDLQTWAPVGWTEFVSRYRGWTNELFDFLAGNEESL